MLPMIKKIFFGLVAVTVTNFLSAAAAANYAVEFASTPPGRLPAGWRDLGLVRSSPNWSVDGKGFLRTVWKGEHGLIVCEANDAGAFADGVVETTFAKTPDATVSLSVVGRLRDARHYYAVRFAGYNELMLLKVADGREEVMAQFVTLRRQQEDQLWTLSLTLQGPRLTGRVVDDKGIEQARVDGLDEGGFASGLAGLRCTNYAAAKTFRIAPEKGFVAGSSPAATKRAAVPANLAGGALAPVKNVEELNTSFARVADSYDVIVAGAGSGGWAAAVQAARLGAKVLLVEQSDWIGGQMAAAAVTSMDEEGVWNKFPVRERGLYREFHDSAVNYYYTLNKDPFRAYYAWPEQLEGGYEPKIVRGILYAFIAEARKNGTLDLVTGTRLVDVRKQGETVTGVTLEQGGERKTPACKVLVEATEYGDVLPLAGARYRVGTVKSDQLEPNSPIQYHTWLAVIREYPEGLPEHLRIKSPPPGYSARSFSKSQLYGRLIWGGPGKGYKGPRVYRVLLAWRGMADSESPMTGVATQQRHTQAGLNGGRQDYPVTVAGIEDPEIRRVQQRAGIYRTLNEIYYFQHELGLPWAVAEDEGYRTPYQEEQMTKLNLRPDLLPIALHLPQWPYVRECRRGMGLYTLRTSDMGRFEEARLFPTSVAMGDYFMDIDHGKTGDAVEKDLDPGKPPRGGGPFQVPFEVFIPEKVDGLVLAEKNISQSRIVNGATRLQPITILTGQAAGAIAALAAREGRAPREVNPLRVQTALLQSGSNLIQRWYEDVPWGTSLWQATQLLSLYGVIDVPAPFVKGDDKPMGAGNFWRPTEALDARVCSLALNRLAELAGKRAPSAAQRLTWAGVGAALSELDPEWRTGIDAATIAADRAVSRGDFALVAAQVLARTGRPILLRDEASSAR